MPINPTTLKTQIDTEITNETEDFAITPAEVGGRMKDIVDYVTEQSALKEVLTNKSTNVTTDGASDTKYPSVKAVKDYVDANSGGGTANYKILKGFINQSSTNNPTITIFENTFSTIPTIVRTGVGIYNFNFSETIDANKIFCLIGNNANDPLFSRMHIGIVSVNGAITVGVNRYRLRNGNAVNDELFDGFTRVSFEIILYP